jgi:hypothetical protein
MLLTTRWQSGALLLIAYAIGATASAQAIFDETAVAVKSGTTVVPTPRTFTVSPADAGMHRITLTDVGVATGGSAAINPKLIVTRGMTAVARLSASGSTDVNLTPGTYVLRLTGRAPAGSYGQLNAVVERNATQVEFYSLGLAPLPPANPTLVNVHEQFQIAESGTYQIELTDRQLPAAMASLQSTVVLNGTQIVCAPATSTCPSTAAIGIGEEYELFVFGSTNATRQAGLFSVRIVDVAANRVAYAKTHAAGKLDKIDTVALGNQQAEISAIDLGFPSSLSELHVALVQDANVAVLRNVGAISSSATLPGRVGDADVYAFAVAQTGAQAGNYGYTVRQGMALIAGAVQAVNGTSVTSSEAFNYQVTLPTAGEYRVRVHDFGFPGFGAVRFALSQNGVLLTSADSASTLPVTAAAGVLDVSVLATASAGTPTAKGLLGVSVTPSASTTPIWETTQGVGGLFQSRSVGVVTAGRYQASFIDQRFPAAFSELILLVTRGTTLVSSIYAAAGTTPTQTTIEVTPGEYAINLLAVSSSAEDYGLYGIKLDDVSPPASPVLTSSPTGSVNAAESGGGGIGVELLLLILALVLTRIAAKVSEPKRRLHLNC